MIKLILKNDNNLTIKKNQLRIQLLECRVWVIRVSCIELLECRV